jgi:hypothetical protein
VAKAAMLCSELKEPLPLSVKSIHFIETEDLTHEMLLSVLQASPNLTFLCLGDCPRLSSLAITAVLPSASASLKNLKSLFFVGAVDAAYTSARQVANALSLFPALVEVLLPYTFDKFEPELQNLLKVQRPKLKMRPSVRPDADIHL